MAGSKHNLENGIILLFILFLNGITTNMLAQENKILKGKVEVVNLYDEEFNYAILIVHSQSEDEEGQIITSIEEYPIEENAIGMKLFQFDGETVEVTCNIIEDNYGPICVRVNSFKIIKSEENESNQPKVHEK